MAQNRKTFSSSLTTVITMVGVAVGLGNVWRFPYMMGKYGGSAFLFFYLLFTILFAIPALMAEFSLGRATGKGTFGAFRESLGNRWGYFIGFLLPFSLLIASSYYVIVIGNVIYSAFFSIRHSFTPTNLELFSAQLNNGWLQYIIAMTCVVFALIIVGRGLQKGIELSSRIFVPFFLVSILYLIFNAFSLEGASKQFIAFLQPDFSALKAEHIFAALGQSFYSLSLGGTFMLTYGSYLKKEENLSKMAIYTGLGDLGAAFLAALFIIPTILVFGLDMTSGPQLIFNTLPQLFIKMPAGALIGSLFLIALSMVAFLSLVGAYEVLLNSIQDLRKPAWSRQTILVGLGVILSILCLPIAHNPNLIGTLDLIFGSGMQVLGSGLAVVALCWGLGKISSLKEIFGNINQGVFLFFWLKYIIPLVLLAIFIGYILQSI